VFVRGILRSRVFRGGVLGRKLLGGRFLRRRFLGGERFLRRGFFLSRGLLRRDLFGCRVDARELGRLGGRRFLVAGSHGEVFGLGRHRRFRVAVRGLVRGQRGHGFLDALGSVAAAGMRRIGARMRVALLGRKMGGRAQHRFFFVALASHFLL